MWYRSAALTHRRFAEAVTSGTTLQLARRTSGAQRSLCTPPALLALAVKQDNHHHIARSARLVSSGRPNMRIDAAYGAHGGEESLVELRALDLAPAGVRSFSDISTPEAVRDVCCKEVPGWAALPRDALNVNQLCEGLSNQNFKVHLRPEVESTVGGAPSCVLFRVYGKDSGTLYDQAVEQRIFSVLSAYQIGPHLYASGDGWRIEEWHNSVPLPNRSMRNPAILVQVASHLGRFHKLSGRPDFPQELLDMQPLSRTRLTTWGEHCRRAAEALAHEDAACEISAFQLDEMLAERQWLADFCLSDDPGINGSGLDVVFSHWDSQENNILQTHYGLRYIDFEYSGMEYQAFDIASYFVECTIDYLHPRAPYFKVSLADFPQEWEQRLFCSVYLSEYLETAVRPEDLAVTVLLERVMRFTLMHHHLWAMWSVIRARQAPTFNNFDYLKYAMTRWFQYKWTKRQLLQGVQSGRDAHPKSNGCHACVDAAPAVPWAGQVWAPTTPSTGV